MGSPSRRGAIENDRGSVVPRTRAEDSDAGANDVLHTIGRATGRPKEDDERPDPRQTPQPPCTHDHVPTGLGSLSTSSRRGPSSGGGGDDGVGRVESRRRVLGSGASRRVVERRSFQVELELREVRRRQKDEEEEQDGVAARVHGGEPVPVGFLQQKPFQMMMNVQRVVEVAVEAKVFARREAVLELDVVAARRLVEWDEERRKQVAGQLLRRFDGVLVERVRDLDRKFSRDRLHGADHRAQSEDGADDD
mmetsp:Transcript_25767/g.102885  ORF Transcript_25767/g.102885 Transcript_25767/m.102885 type:complete len:250 (-) Transcript_25767:367-1116(-)